MDTCILEENVSILTFGKKYETKLQLFPHQIVYSLGDKKHTIPLALTFGVNLLPQNTNWLDVTNGSSSSTASGSTTTTSTSSSFSPKTLSRLRKSVHTPKSPSDFAVSMLHQVSNSKKGNEKALQIGLMMYRDAAAESEMSVSIDFIVHVLIADESKKFIDEPPVYKPLIVSCESSQSAKNWVNGIKSVMVSGKLGVIPPKQKLAMFINPAGGLGKAPKIYSSITGPMLEIAGIDVEVTETKHREHVTNIVKELEISKYDILASVSGDGLLHEMIDGIFNRPDWKEFSQSVKVGVVGGGSSNAINKVLDSVYPELSTLALIKGSSRKMDIFSVVQGKRVYYSHLCISWGLLADIDIESNAFRWLGTERFTLAGIFRLSNFRKYTGSLFAMKVTDASPIPESGKHLDKYPEIKFTTPSVTGLPLSEFETDTKKYDISLVNVPIKNFCMCNIPWISQDILMAPNMKLNDGYFHVNIANEQLDRKGSLGLILDGKSGGHLEWSCVQQFKTKVLYIDPHPRSGERINDVPEDLSEEALKKGNKGRGIIAVSGEEIHYAPIRIEVHPGVLNIIAPVWLDEDDNSQPFGVKNSSGKALEMAIKRVEEEWIA